MKRTMWFGPIEEHYATANRLMVNNTFNDQASENGIVKDIRLRIGKKIPGKTNNKSIYMFVEFEDEINVNKTSKLVYKGRIPFSRKAYLCGTNTFSLIRKSKK